MIIMAFSVSSPLSGFYTADDGHDSSWSYWTSIGTGHGVSTLNVDTTRIRYYPIQSQIHQQGESFLSLMMGPSLLVT